MTELAATEFDKALQEFASLPKGRQYGGASVFLHFCNRGHRNIRVFVGSDAKDGSKYLSYPENEGRDHSWSPTVIAFRAKDIDELREKIRINPGIMTYDEWPRSCPDWGSWMPGYKKVDGGSGKI